MKQQNFQFLDKSDQFFFYNKAEEIIRAEPKIAIEVYERFMPDKNFYKAVGKSETYKAMKGQIKAREAHMKKPRYPSIFYVGIAIEQIMRVLIKSDVGAASCLGPCYARKKPMDKELHAKIKNMYFGDNEERKRPMENKKERLKKIVREEMDNTILDRMGFYNIISIEPLQGNDPDAPAAFSRSHKPYKVTLPGGIKYIFAKHFTDHDNSMPEKAFLSALGRAPEIPKPFQLAVNKLVLKALSKQGMGHDAEKTQAPNKPAHVGAYIDRPDGQRVYAKGKK